MAALSAAPENAAQSASAEVISLHSLYQVRRSETEVDAGTTGGSVPARIRRILHFKGYHETRSGKVRFDQVVTIVPGERMWIGLTVDPKTRRYEAAALWDANIDPFELLRSQGEYVIETELRQPMRWSWLRCWRAFWGWRIRPRHPDVDYAMQLIGMDVPRVKRPDELYTWVLGMQPPTRARSKGQALGRGVKAFVGDLVAP